MCIRRYTEIEIAAVLSKPMQTRYEDTKAS